MLNLENATQSCHDHMSYVGMSGGRSFVEDLMKGMVNTAIQAIKTLLEKVARNGLSIILVIFDNYVKQRLRKNMNSDEKFSVQWPTMSVLVKELFLYRCITEEESNQTYFQCIDFEELSNWINLNEGIDLDCNTYDHIYD